MPNRLAALPFARLAAEIGTTTIPRPPIGSQHGAPTEETEVSGL
ncbi:hypothetical protein [Hoyosella rhizosphaerae]|nr:hypothetical protein [Hoyosella rhizosphaerae]